MALISARDLSKLVSSKGLKWTLNHLHQALEAKEIAPHDFSIRDMAQNLITDGHEYVRKMDPRTRSGGMNMLEANGAVDTTAFSNITGQIIYSAILQGLQNAEFIGDNCVTVMPSEFQDSEKIPGISAVSDEFGTEIEEGAPYPLVGLSEEYVEIGRAEKKGGIIGLTRETIIADRTGLIVDRAKSIGKGLGMQREKSILDVVLGVVNPYKRNGVAYDTYLTTGAWINNASNTLVDYTDVDAAEQLLKAIVDPNTGEPIMISANTIIVPPALHYTARRIVNATEVRSGDITSGAGNQTIGVNPIPTNYQILSNQYVKLRTSSDAYWFLGNPKEAFVWKEIWPLTVEEAPNNNEAQFTSDIWMRFKASYKGVAGVREPRAMVKST